jgi:hypothetical protein
VSENTALDDSAIVLPLNEHHVLFEQAPEVVIVRPVVFFTL